MPNIIIDHGNPVLREVELPVRSDVVAAMSSACGKLDNILSLSVANKCSLVGIFQFFNMHSLEALLRPRATFIQLPAVPRMLIMDEGELVVPDLPVARIVVRQGLSSVARLDIAHRYKICAAEDRILWDTATVLGVYAMEYEKIGDDIESLEDLEYRGEMGLKHFHIANKVEFTDSNANDIIAKWVDGLIKRGILGAYSQSVIHHTQRPAAIECS